VVLSQDYISFFCFRNFWLIFAQEGIFDFLSNYNVTKYGIGQVQDINAFIRNKEMVASNIEYYYKNYELTDIAKMVFSLEMEKTKVKYSKSEYLDYAIDYINNNLESGVTANMVAKQLNLCERYLYKLFKQKHGVTLKEYIDNLKVEKAKILIKKTDLSFTEIAKKVGIEDVFSFSRFFKNKTGYSPTEYKKI